MVLDPSASRFSCGPCTATEQLLRNCSGKGKPAKIFLNGGLYTRCPRAIYLESRAEQFLVELYFSCKNMGGWPVSGGFLNQTAFTVQLFNYINGVVIETQNRQEKEAQRKAGPK